MTVPFIYGTNAIYKWLFKVYIVVNKPLLTVYGISLRDLSCTFVPESNIRQTATRALRSA